MKEEGLEFTSRLKSSEAQEETEGGCNGFLIPATASRNASAYKWKLPSSDQLTQRKNGAAITYPRRLSTLKHRHDRAWAVLKSFLLIGKYCGLLNFGGSLSHRDLKRKYRFDGWRERFATIYNDASVFEKRIFPVRSRKFTVSMRVFASIRTSPKNCMPASGERSGSGPVGTF